MPVITLEGPPLEIDEKREMVRRLTDVASEIYGIEHIIVLMKENQPQNVGSNGKLVADME